MQADPLSDMLRYLKLGSDPLRDGSLLLCLLVFLAGAVLLGLRIRAAWKGLEALPSLLACRMTAVLGALGGFVAYLRDLPRPEARFGLVAGGASALPWALLILLEAARRMMASGRSARDGRRE
jgi:hypothetical protein